MKLPPSFKILMQLKWQGNAIDAQTMQRLHLRLLLWGVVGWLVTMVVMVMFGFVVGIVGGIAGKVLGFSTSWLSEAVGFVAMGVSLFVMLLWVALRIKLKVCRLRDYGLTIWPILGLLLIPTGIVSVASLAHMFHPNPLFLWVALPFTAVAVLCRYYVFFGKPEAGSGLRVAPLGSKPVGVFEKLLLVAQVIIIWLSIIISPLVYMGSFSVSKNLQQDIHQLNQL